MNKSHLPLITWHKISLQKPKMSQNCRKQLRRRQKVIAEDYKADYGFTKACRIPIKKYKCRKQADIDLEEIGEIDSNEVKKTRLSSILLCLEGMPLVYIRGINSTSFLINEKLTFGCFEL